MGAYIHRQGMTSVGQIIQSLYSDLIANGFETVFPQSGPLTLGPNGDGKFVVESTGAVNPLNDGQAYRILVEKPMSPDIMRIVIAGKNQISNTGIPSEFPDVVGTNDKRPVMGHLGHEFTVSTTTLGTIPPGPVFLPRGVVGSSSQRINTHAAYTETTGVEYSYCLSISDHGVVFYLWENSTEPEPIFSMFCVQLPVDKDTGAPLLTDKSPIFCVYNCDNSGFMKFVVNESDVGVPSRSVSAGRDSENSAAILNEEEQVAVKLNNQYLVTFPNRVNTERFAYSEELDMLAYSSADVIGEDTVLPITVYGEATPRKYRSMKATGPHNTKMRLLILQEGGGVPAPQEPSEG